MRREADCHKCRQRAVLAGKEWPFPTYMIVCPTCGNKRCPKASDHDLACTGSNEPGQPGSIYGAMSATPPAAEGEKSHG